VSNIGALTQGFKDYFFAELIYIITAASLRTSVALLLRRIASTGPMRIAIYVLIFLMVSFSLAFFLVTLLQCSPIGYFWDWNPVAAGKCSKHKVLADIGYGTSVPCIPNRNLGFNSLIFCEYCLILSIAHTVFMFVADWALALLPIWLLWKVQISRRRKVGIAILLSFGLV
jgi:hypothetical protein